MAKMAIQSASLDELRAELTHTRLGHEIFESVEANAGGSSANGSDASRLASFVASLITDLYDTESSSAQNRLRLTTNLEMAADRLQALAQQLRSQATSETAIDGPGDQYLLQKD
ncbi:MAG: hypothetical protein WD314_16815 [Trueperaceae bacterium]